MVNFIAQPQVRFPASANVRNALVQLGDVTANAIRERRQRNALARVSEAAQTGNLNAIAQAQIESGIPQVQQAGINTLAQLRGQDIAQADRESARELQERRLSIAEQAAQRQQEQFETERSFRQRIANQLGLGAAPQAAIPGAFVDQSALLADDLSAATPMVDPTAPQQPARRLVAPPQSVFANPTGGQPIVGDVSPEAKRGAALQISAGDTQGAIRTMAKDLSEQAKLRRPTEKQRGQASDAVAAFRALDGQLQDFAALVQQTGFEAAPGPQKQRLDTLRRSIQLQMKELFNLGVLNGPDLLLMDQLLFDPTISVDSLGDIARLPGQIISVGAGLLQGGAGRLAESNVKQLRELFSQQLRAKLSALPETGIQDPTRASARPQTAPRTQQRIPDPPPGFVVVQ